MIFRKEHCDFRSPVFWTYLRTMGLEFRFWYLNSIILCHRIGFLGIFLFPFYNSVLNEYVSSLHIMKWFFFIYRVECNLKYDFWRVSFLFWDMKVFCVIYISYNCYLLLNTWCTLNLYPYEWRSWSWERENKLSKAINGRSTVLSQAVWLQSLL